MKEDNKHIDKIFRDALLNHTAEPPEMIWASVRQRVYTGKKKKLIPWFYRIAAGVAILTGISLGILYLADVPKSEMVSEKLPEQPLMIQPETNEFPGAESILPTPEIKEPGPVILAAKQIKDEPVPTYSVSVSDELSGLVTEVASEREPEPILPKLLQHDSTESLQPAEMLFVETPEQNFEERKVVKRQWEIGFHSAPSYSYRSISPASGSNEVYSYLNRAENGKLSLSGYLYLKTKFTSRLGMRTGIRFSTHGYTTGGIAQITSLDGNPVVPDPIVQLNSFLLCLNNSAGPINYSSNALLLNQLNAFDPAALYSAFPASAIELESNFRLVQNFYFLGIPFEGIFYPGRNESIFLVFGFEPGVLLGNSVYFDSGESVTWIGNTVGLNKYYFSTSAGVGMEFAMMQNLSLTIEPGFQYFLSSLNSNHIVAARPYSFGVSFGLNFRR